MIKDILKDSINRLNSERSSAIATAIAKNKNEVVNPKFAELESTKNSAISEIQKETAEKISEVTQLCAQAKTEFENEQKDTITASVGAEYDLAIANVNKLMPKEEDGTTAS